MLFEHLEVHWPNIALRLVSHKDSKDVIKSLALAINYLGDVYPGFTRLRLHESKERGVAISFNLENSPLFITDDGIHNGRLSDPLIGLPDCKYCKELAVEFKSLLLSFDYYHYAISSDIINSASEVLALDIVTKSKMSAYRRAGRLSSGVFYLYTIGVNEDCTQIALVERVVRNRVGDREVSVVHGSQFAVSNKGYEVDENAR